MADPTTPASWDEEHARAFVAGGAELMAPLYPWLARDLDALWGRPWAGCRVVEIGGGAGNMAVELLGRGVARHLDVDLSPALLAAARTKVGAALPAACAGAWCGCCGEAGALPLVAGCADLVYSRGSVQFWPDLPAAFAHIGRVLAPGGLAVVGGGYGRSTPAALREEVMRRRRERAQEAGGDVSPPHLPMDSMRAAAAAVGGAQTLIEEGGRWLLWWPHGRGSSREM